MSDGRLAVASMQPLGAGEVQVWRIDLAEAEESAEAYSVYLSGEELKRAERLRAGQVRMQFVVGRACLRVLLGSLFALPPKEVSISLSAYGKPETAAVDGRPVYFNVAHSRETVVIALCREGRVGIDLEYLDRETDVLEVAQASFARSEFQQIEAAGGAEEQRRAFFRCWTRKEAVVKADGRGLSLPLTAFEVSVVAAARSELVRIAREGDAEAKTWFVSDLDLGPKIAGAYAVEAAELRLSAMVFPLAELGWAG